VTYNKPDMLLYEEELELIAVMDFTAISSSG
jgi:hypothetical protein